MSEPALRDLFLAIPPKSSLESLESYGKGFAEWQRGVNWWIGDLARYAEARFPDTWNQVFPEWMSPGLVARCFAVAKAYPREGDRNSLATWTIHMQHANQPDRIARVQAAVDAGRTSDEERQQERPADDNRPRWLLAFDVHYFVHRHYFSGAGVETATQVTEWIKRTVERLKVKGATDVLCAFEGIGSFRKQLTAGPEWAENRYKDRPPKPADLIHQLQLVRELLAGFGFACHSVDQYEADDVLASAAAHFPGKVTIISSDKDLRQCLSDHVNILLDVEWARDDTSGDLLPDYKWLTAKQHTESMGIRPEQWADYQAIMGDNTDGVQGAAGVGKKGAADLIKEFDTIDNVIQAAKEESDSIKPKTREALIEFESRLDVTRQMVALKTDLPIPSSTRI